MREILVSAASHACAVMEDGHLCEYIPEEESGASGAILLGKVVRVVKANDAAFVDIGEERNGFLPLKERSDSFVGQPLREGDRVTVQIVREAHGEKGAFLTRDINLAGESVIFMPCNRFIGASGKLAAAEADRLRTLGRELSSDRFGLVMRTAAAAMTKEAIAAEIDSMQALWFTIAIAAPTAPAPSVLWQGRTVLESLLDDYVPRGVETVISDDPTIAPFCDGRCPFRLVNADPLETAGIPAKLEEALHRRVWLKSGANLVIDECEALTVIDVNTAKNTARRVHEKALASVNAEACAEIARQIRLRSIGGIIIIDMIDMIDEDDKAHVLEALRSAFAADRSKTVIHGYTSLGLIEMTRRRTRKSLRETLKKA
ncbi:MAG: ribonuclease E/G [Clostridia bacterium]|nr:ribonuclease E/G [Clostridia bacterium]